MTEPGQPGPFDGGHFQSSPTPVPASDPGTDAVPPSSPGPRQRPGAPRPKRTGLLVGLVAGGLALVLLVAGGVTAAVLVLGGITARNAVRASPVGDAETVLVEQGGDARPVTGSETIEPGDSVRARSGLTQLDVGQAASVRLASDAAVTLDRKPQGGQRARLTVDAGRAYVVATPASGVEVDALGVRATVTAGRLVVACTEAICAFQALEEPQRLVTPGGTTVALSPHQRYDFDPTATEAPPEQTLPGGTGSGTTTAAIELVATATTTTPPDALRQDEFLTRNATLDAEQDRAYPAVRGRSVVGTYSMTLTSELVSAPVRRALELDVSCVGATGCVVTAVVLRSACPEEARVCETTGTVVAEDQRGDSLRLFYSGFGVDCGAVGEADGTGRFTDVLTFSGSEESPTISGTRSAVLVPEAGSSCEDEKDRFLRQRIPITAEKGSPGDDFPNLDEEQLLGRHVNAGYTCERATEPLAGAAAHLVCDPGSPKDFDGYTRPERLELLSFADADRLETAYDSYAARSGLRREGTCGREPCEEPWEGEAGRIVLYGSGKDGRLAAFLPERSNTLVVANGGTVRSLYDWHQKSTDISYGGLHLFGI